MIEDDLTVVEMRRAATRPTSRPQIFMAASELRVLRTTVMRVPQRRLAEQLIKPTTGEPVTVGTICKWETGQRPIPLWAARRIRDLAEVARRYDRKAALNG